MFLSDVSYMGKNIVNTKNRSQRSYLRDTLKKGWKNLIPLYGAYSFIVGYHKEPYLAFKTEEKVEDKPRRKRSGSPRKKRLKASQTNDSTESTTEKSVGIPPAVPPVPAAETSAPLVQASADDAVAASILGGVKSDDVTGGSH